MPRGKKSVIPENIEEKIAEVEKEISELTAQAKAKKVEEVLEFLKKK